MTPLAAVVVVVATMALVVAASMVVENWRHLVQPIRRSARVGADASPPVGVADPVDPVRPVEPDRDEPTAGATAPPLPSPPMPAAAPMGPPAAGRPGGAVVARPGAVAIRDAATAEVLAAVLFAAFASRRTAGADRASAWVTLADTPPGVDPARFPAGIDLRARPARVDELLGHGGDGCWLTLQPRVDIGRGVARTPVRQAALAGLVTWWAHSCAGPGVLEPETVASVRDAVAAVRPRVEQSAWAEPVAVLHRALREAGTAGTALLVDVGGATSEPGGAAPDATPAPVPQSSAGSAGSS